MKIIISQPMYFPWKGLFEQIRLADIFIFFDDVQFTRGKNFINRVELKGPKGQIWMTVPVYKKGNRLMNINQMRCNNQDNWKSDHLKMFTLNYKKAPYFKEAYEILEGVLNSDDDNLANITIDSVKRCAKYFNLKTKFITSSSLGISGKSNERLIKTIKRFGGTVYITGHGGRKYLDYEQFESNNIKVYFMDYQKIIYPQLWGKFETYVSILDLIANLGEKGRNYLNSPSIYWKTFLRKDHE